MPEKQGCRCTIFGKIVVQGVPPARHVRTLLSGQCSNLGLQSVLNWDTFTASARLIRSSILDKVARMGMLQTKSRRANTQDLILNAALRLFTGRGYFNTSVQDIAQTSGASIGSIYHHFDDKEGVARALYQRELGAMSDALESIIIHHGSVEERCRAVIELLFQLTEQRPAAMEFMLYAKHREFLPGERPVCSSRPFELMRKIVAAGIETGEIQALTPVVASTALFGGALRLIAARLDGVIDQPLTELLEETWRCGWRSVSG